jgi:uncharacterized membrane protein YfcA
MNDIWVSLSAGQMLALGLCFVWSGFVRSGLGFGGAALALPLLLMIIDDPIMFLPTICWQLLFFSLLTIVTRLHNVNWPYLGRLCLLLAAPFAAGLFGLLSLPGPLLSLIVYVITLFYGVTYALNRVLFSQGRLADTLCLAIGGYVSGVSLVGAPLIVAVATRVLPVHQLRDTLFVMWIILVLCKLSTFAVASVDMQWQFTLLTFPLVGIGHMLGLRAHARLISGDRRRFNRVIGSGLSAVSLLGLFNLLGELV